MLHQQWGSAPDYDKVMQSQASVIPQALADPTGALMCIPTVQHIIKQIWTGFQE